jgi:hypothetical protein
MKGGVRKKEFFILVISNFITFPLIGWYIGGIVPALIGFSIALIIDRFFPTWKYELTWSDIDLALYNIYKYGSNPCELCFLVGNRKVFVYRDERGNEKRPIRMSIRLPLEDWSDLFDKKGFSKLLHEFGGMGLYSKDRGPECYGLFPRGGREDCKEILKVLFQKSVGGLRPDIYARSVVNAKKNIWIDHSHEGKNGTSHQKSRVR